MDIDLNQSEVLETVHRFYYIIHIYQQRDSEPRTNLNNKLLNTNMIDNLNETYSIATKLINNVRSYNNDLAEAEKALAKEIEEQSKARGNSEMSIFDNGINMD